MRGMKEKSANTNSSLINLSGLESAMGAILSKLKDQEDEIASLKAISSTQATRSDVIELERKLNMRFNALEQRVEQLEKEITVDSSGKYCSPLVSR